MTVRAPASCPHGASGTIPTRLPALYRLCRTFSINPAQQDALVRNRRTPGNNRSLQRNDRYRSGAPEGTSGFPGTKKERRDPLPEDGVPAHSSTLPSLCISSM